MGAAAVDVGAGVAGVVQNGQDLVVAQRFPVQLPGPGAGGVAGGELEAGGFEGLDDRAGGAGLFEGGEQVGDRLADPGVGVEDDVAGGVVG